MERVHASKVLPDVSPEERISSDLLKQIRKLRWIGMEQEAQRLQVALGVVWGRSNPSAGIMMSRNSPPASDV